MSLVPLRIRNIMVRRMGLAEEPVDEFVEALDEMTDDYVPKSEWDAQRMQMRLDQIEMFDKLRQLMMIGFGILLATLLALGGIIIGLLVG